jgi:CheY-like chemotaxis protein
MRRGEIMPSALLLCDDLMFASRITGEARALGLLVRPVRTLEHLFGLVRQEEPSCVLLDLAFPGLELSDFFRQLSEACPSLPRVVAYGSHVDTQLLQAARAAGCDPVLPRSKFIEELPKALPHWFAD